MSCKVTRDLVTKEGFTVVNDYSLRHDIFRPFYSPGPLFQKGFDGLRHNDIIYGPDLASLNGNSTLYKITNENEFVAVDPQKNKATRTDIKIRGWSLFKFKGCFVFYIIYFISKYMIRCILMWFDVI